ncbi:hypothetical protein CHU98_g4910 [Xylaria longipes]|nr:hypothetical protein CHU98_g4910 [Xylaria longipes]
MSVLERFARHNHSPRARDRPYFKPKPVRISDDGRGNSLFSRQRDIMNQCIMTDQSLDPLTPSDSVGPHWNQAELLDLSDSVRAGLLNGHVFSPDAESLSSFLETALKDEERRYPTLNFETIEYARLDKLLSEIIQCIDTIKTSDLSPDFLLRLRVNVSQAKNLRRAWRRRFREQFFMIDQHRAAVLVKGGRLKDVSFNSSLDYDLGKWQTMRVSGPVSEVEANLQFEPGHAPTADRLGGDDSSQHGRTKNSDFRGYKLKSIFAPEAGVRYDGLYVIRQYGYKFDSSINKYRLDLTLERATDQRPFEDIRKIPKPSQLDDWTLYEKLEGDKVRLLQGESSYLEWKLKRQEERIDREDWQQARLFRASFSVGAGARGERMSKSSVTLRS